jgi:hypothetical protein
MYIPLIPQLHVFFASPEVAKKLQYRHSYNNPRDTIADIFDGEWYNELCCTNMTIENKEQPYKFFEGERNIALGLSADGMCPFKCHKNSCWPLILVNYNLPPDECTHMDNLICVRVTPGPKWPADLNSFLQPLIEELLELTHGVSAVDTHKSKLFALQAYLIDVFGDIPVMTKLLEFISHNGCFPCLLCLMPTVSGSTSGGGVHRYCPLHQLNNHHTNPMNLPLHTHEECIECGLEVLRAPTDNARNKLATKSRIKGVSLLAQLPSISILALFPIDLMHMIWQNLIPQLIDLGHVHSMT